jgi:AraC-like DNA-binding protein
MEQKMTMREQATMNLLQIPQDRRVRKVIRLLHDVPQLRRQELAASVNLSIWHLAHLFKRETGVRLNRYIQEVRLHRSVELLKHTNEPIKRIAFQTGYEHSSSFIRAFIIRYGESPERYRRRNTA